MSNEGDARAPEGIDYTIVIPVYFNEGCLKPTMDSIRKEVIEKNPNYRCQVIFVDDGSEDGSLKELMEIRESDPKIVRVVKLTRNFGQLSAMMAGLSLVRSKCAITMSADGQDPTSLINEMLKYHFQEGYEIVIGTRKSREESYFRVLTSRIFYSLMRKLTFRNMPPGGFDFILMGRKSLRVFINNMDVHEFGQGIILWMGYRIKFIEYERKLRIAGVSKYTFGKKLTFFIDGLLSFSYTPLRISSLAGIILAVIGFLYANLVFWGTLIFGNPVQGWAPIVVLVLIIGGFQLIMLGIVGEYIWRILVNVRKRDLFIVEKIYDEAEE